MEENKYSLEYKELYMDGEPCARFCISVKYRDGDGIYNIAQSEICFRVALCCAGIMNEEIIGMGLTDKQIERARDYLIWHGELPFKR